MKIFKNKMGFTMIELLSAMVVLGLIVGIAVPAISETVNKTRNKTYVSDALKLISNAEYQFRKDNTLPKPTKSRCIVMSLVYLNNGVFDEAPNGGEYLRNKSFVVAVNDNLTNETKYYVRLVEDRGDNEYRGIDLNSKDELNEEAAYNYVTNFEGSSLYGIGGSDSGVILGKIKSKISQCSSIHIYAPNSGEE